MFSLTNISGTVCSKKRHFEYILKRASICHVYLWKHLQISSCLALFLLISSHGVAAKPATWVAANVTGRFTATNWREFLGEKNKLCTCKPYNLECHYACIYGFNLVLTLCQPPVSVLVADYPGRLYIYICGCQRGKVWAGKKSACENGSLLWRDEQMRCSRERCTGNVALTFTLTVGWNENIIQEYNKCHTQSIYIVRKMY